MRIRLPKPLFSSLFGLTNRFNNGDNSNNGSEGDPVDLMKHKLTIIRRSLTWILLIEYVHCLCQGRSAIPAVGKWFSPLRRRDR
jgi:hypothetical protein